MTTVADIAKDAFDAVSGSITDAIHSATITSTAKTAYDTVSGSYSETVTTATGRAVLVTERPVQDIFPDYIAGEGDQLWMLEGFSAVTALDKLTVGSDTYHIRAVQDIAGAGTVFYVVARK